MEIINANEKKCQICGKHLKICDWTIYFLSLFLSLSLRERMIHSSVFNPTRRWGESTRHKDFDILRRIIWRVYVYFLSTKCKKQEFSRILSRAHVSFTIVSPNYQKIDTRSYTIFLPPRWIIYKNYVSYVALYAYDILWLIYIAWRFTCRWKSF